MTTACLTEPTFRPLATEEPAPEILDLAEELRTGFGVDFSLWDGGSGEMVYAGADQPVGDPSLIASLVGEVQLRPEPQFLGDEDCVLLFALPFQILRRRLIAVAAFATRPAEPHENVAGAARLLDLSESDVVAWINRQPVWTADALLRFGKLLLVKRAAETRARRLEGEIESVAENLTTTYEEISLLYSVAQNLRISNSDEELGAMVVGWLKNCVPADCIAIQFLPVAADGDVTYKARTQRNLLTSGECPVSNEEFARIIETLNLQATHSPMVANRKFTCAGNWQFPQVRQFIIAPLSVGTHIFGWLAVFNHADGGEFGTEEAGLISSVGAMLGIHSGNRELYRQQAEFLADVVQAFTSAIDAKDPYTCGHSDRVARISVRLAKELKCDREVLNTIYMAGLLHDIGKIGINDNVLGKPGRLTEAEFEHIKLHPELGYKILADLRKLQDVLPAVLHHHEQWDGAGYPKRLQGENIPLIARVMAVADAYDAMTSDRPYRQGMPEAKVDAIFRAGSGKQWDPSVVQAFFAARDDIRNLCRKERAQLSLDVEQWS